MENERTRPKSLSRRRFLADSAGLTFAVMTYTWLPGCTVDEGTSVYDQTAFSPDGLEKQLTAWVRIHPDNNVIFYNPAAEMGQGSMTALAVIMAEELDVDWSQVYIENSPIEPETYGLSWGGRLGGRMLTVGSRTVRGYFTGLRIAGAQARQILLQNTADHWGVPLEELTTGSGMVHHTASDRSISYGEIVQFATVPETAPDILEDELKPSSEFRLIGKVDVPRWDIPEKTNGEAMFSMDVNLPDMAYGMITRTPVHGGKPISWNDDELKSMPGVIATVGLEHGVGVIANSIEECLAAKEAMKIEWDHDVPAASHHSETAYEEYLQVAERMEGAREVSVEGDVRSAAHGAFKRYTADFKNDYCYHAQMEPLNAVVHYDAEAGKAEAWVGSQAPDTAREAVARELDLPLANVQLYPHYLGGGFGRRSMDGYVAEAAILARETPRPVKLIWTREDDVRYGAFRPMCLQRLHATVDQSGNIQSWHYRIVGPGDRLLASGAETSYYSFANHRIEVRAIEHGIRTKHWRAVGHGPNKYAIETFIDEIATDLGQDPVEYRLRLLRDHPRGRAVLQKAAEMADWGGAVPEDRARGVAFIERSGSYVAGICELSCDRDTGKLKTHKFWIAVDAGIVVQRDNTIAQLEGGLVMGLSSVLQERITVKDGLVQQSNFHDYPLLRMSDAPEHVEIGIVESDEAPAGIGEASLPAVGGAVANAFAALTGKHLRSMPFTPERVLEALQTTG